MHCCYCQKEIKKKDTKYESKQKGIEGPYHWNCFVKVTKEANRLGNQKLENNIQGTGNMHANTPIDMFS
jgi:copper chaperone CopZ